MRWKSIIKGRPGIACAMASFVAALIAWLTPLGHLSYEWPFAFKSRRQVSEAVIIYMDDKSFRMLEQTPHAWDRTLHAKLIDHLSRDGAKLIVLDSWLTDPGEAAANEKLASAIKKSGRVVLAVKRDTSGPYPIHQVLPPRDEFRDVAAGWGIAGVPDGSAAVGQVDPGDEDVPNPVPSLPWAAAVVARPELTNGIGQDVSKLWLNYYGPHETIRGVSYAEATNQPAGFFGDKLVFIGTKPRALYAFEKETEKFPVPFWRWGGKEAMPGVEIMATATLNLVRGEWLTRLSTQAELLLLLLTSLFLAWQSRFVRPGRAIVTGVLAIAGISVIALVFFISQRIWFSWLTIVACQIPVGVAMSIVLQRGKQAEAPSPSPASLSSATTLQDSTPSPAIPDHQLLRRVGEGSYGEVWLARNILGEHRAVKLIHRHRFSSDGPYEREFKGIQRYSPISRSHPGWVHILHVGRDDNAKFFFYIMEAGDDQTQGQKFDPASYKPKTLSSELEQRGRLPLAEVVKMGISLAASLEHLHQHQLVHRDIKPSNIIFVCDAPKFVDIGLVTEIRRAGKDVSYLGTDGYIAPEGPGTPSADVYSLGKLLYEISTGRDRREFPERSASLLEPSSPAWQRFEQVLLKACEINPRQRYQAAAELQAELSEVQEMLKP